MTDSIMLRGIAEAEEQVTSALPIPPEMYARQIGFFDHLEILHLRIKEVKHTVPGKAITQRMNIAIGSPYHKDTNLRPDRWAAHVVGQEQLPDQSGINSLLRRFTPTRSEDLTLIPGLTLRQCGEVSQAEAVVMDLDGLGLLANRTQGFDFPQFELVFPQRGHVCVGKGDFGHYPGEEGYHGFVACTDQYREIMWFQRDVFGDTGPGDLGLKCFAQDLMCLPVQIQVVGRTIHIKLMVGHKDARMLAEAIASFDAQEFGRLFDLSSIWGLGLRDAPSGHHFMGLGP